MKRLSSSRLLGRYMPAVYAIHEANDQRHSFAQTLEVPGRWEPGDYFKRPMLTELGRLLALDRFIPESEVTPLGVDADKGSA